jgi:hypothetical protein
MERAEGDGRAVVPGGMARGSLADLRRHERGVSTRVIGPGTHSEPILQSA